MTTHKNSPSILSARATVAIGGLHGSKATPVAARWPAIGYCRGLFRKIGHDRTLNVF